MLQYLIIQLDDTSTSYCHYPNTKSERRLISLEDLKAGVQFGMKENLMIQYVLPDYELPQEYVDVLESIDHSKIAASESVYAKNADVVVLNGLEKECAVANDGVYVLRIDKASLFGNYERIIDIFKVCTRLNVVITDLDTFTDTDFDIYKQILSSFSKELESLYASGKLPQMNLLTDRMMLDAMNNCNAGCENITLAPDGKFYVCPAFYLADDEEDFGLGKSKTAVGSLARGLDIKNPQLYKLSHAPLCRNCDAYQCKRCVWLNRKTTYEVNTPSRQQCVAAHLERNVSRALLMDVRKYDTYLTEKDDIKEIAYLDPFDVRKDW